MGMNGLWPENTTNDELSVLARSTERQLVERFGHLLTLQQVAELFHRTPDGLRVSLGRNTDFSYSLNAAKRRIGRRIYFRASVLARLIEEGEV